jgi:hypothetical protein
VSNRRRPGRNPWQPWTAPTEPDTSCWACRDGQGTHLKRCPNGCKTNKRRFASEQEALVQLTEARIAAALHRCGEKRREDRPYPCPFCRGWHLTSQPKGRITP